jgi:hypothetical protein
MWGMSAGFVPGNTLLRIVLGPVAAWLGMGVGLTFYVQYFSEVTPCSNRSIRLDPCQRIGGDTAMRRLVDRFYGIDG